MSKQVCVLGLLICIFLLSVSCNSTHPPISQDISSNEASQISNEDKSSDVKSETNASSQYLIKEELILFQDVKPLDISKWKEYKNKIYPFTLKYPSQYQILEEKYRIEDQSKGRERDPDNGVHIFFSSNKQDFIYVKGNISTPQNPYDDTYKQEGKELFRTNNGNLAEFVYYYDGNKILAYIEYFKDKDLHNSPNRSTHHDARIEMSKDCFNNKKDVIFALLKSVTPIID
ncbi:hypothetical protein RBG61_03645 [Paludicola sp. MB14-C6]|uniref:hypothetical protein n=1 Tax=Paludihabitans sp. MB14-C6 TaxID=3070656 RepID=UPI0027DAE6F5|nr:hypothetical protein [Paludicola sp. MB14-C6]WMJ23769.1 hypothetical protein RBG61_03645 [Paludicola sp. MB14-C6]